MNFKLVSKNKPTGDQPKAIKLLEKNLKEKVSDQVLIGVTGSGKTFTIANVIANTNRTALVLSHNKTLASQLYIELKELFPNNRVEYFVSYFDFYQPEAYMPKTDTYIDKLSKSNWDLEAMRMSALNALSTRKDTIAVASVAAIYGALSPKEYVSSFMYLKPKMNSTRKALLKQIVEMNYNRNPIDLNPGSFRVRGDVIEIAPGWTNEYYLRIDMDGDIIEEIAKIDTLTGEVLSKHEEFTLFPADAYTMKRETIDYAIENIKIELVDRLAFFKKENKLLEAQRLEQRVNHDLDSLSEFGTCPGIENYSMYMDHRKIGEKPYTLFDYVPKDTLLFIDESHMMIPQINAMYNGDRSRKETLVNYGFRLPSALDNRPLKFEEFLAYDFQRVYVSATPSNYEIDKSNGLVVEQIVRPTGLLEPIISVKPKTNQIETILDEIKLQINKNERTIILTTTIRMAEELAKFLQTKKLKVSYIHNELKTLERTEILRKLRKGLIEVVVGINLLKEGIDLPEVSLVLVLDADQESFFRSTRALIQIIGRSARNVNGRVIFFADRMTPAMEESIAIVNRRRLVQNSYNKKHGIVPKTIVKDIPAPIAQDGKEGALNKLLSSKKIAKKQKDELLKDLHTQMLRASKDMKYERAAQLRDIILELQED